MYINTGWQALWAFYLEEPAAIVGALGEVPGQFFSEKFHSLSIAIQRTYSFDVRDLSGTAYPGRRHYRSSV
jgi:hypothetical protein